MLNFACSDTESQCSESTVCRGVAVSTHDSGSGEGETLLGPNDMNDPLTFVSKTKISKLECLNIVL